MTTPLTHEDLTPVFEALGHGTNTMVFMLEQHQGDWSLDTVTLSGVHEETSWSVDLAHGDWMYQDDLGDAEQGEDPHLLLRALIAVGEGDEDAVEQLLGGHDLLGDVLEDLSQLEDLLTYALGVEVLARLPGARLPDVEGHPALVVNGQEAHLTLHSG